MRALLALSFCSILAAPALAHDRLPGAAQDHPIALVGGDIHPVEGAPIIGGTIIFERGKISALGGKEISLPAGTERIDIAGLRVYPGLIALGTRLGLVEIDAVRATRDTQETGSINPNARADVSINPDSELIPVTRANGIALAGVVPDGALIAGTATLIRLDGWTYEDLVVQAASGVHIRWPAVEVGASGNEEADKKAIEARDEALRSIREALVAAQGYLRGTPSPPGAGGSARGVDLRSEALLSCLRRELPTFLHAEDLRQIESALDFAKEFSLRPVIVGGADAVLVAGRLAAEQVPVIYGPVHRLPAAPDDAYDAPFVAPAALHAAGVRFAIASFETSNARNLPYHAATAAAYGLSREEALRAITLSPAEILGVADRVGSLKVGKDATLIVTSGDPLEATANVRLMWIEGRAVDLASRHTELYKKYRERIRRVLGK